MTSTARSVIVFGGSRGIGNAVAQRFIRNGDHVALVARSSEALQHAALSSGAKSHFVADVANNSQVKKVFESLNKIDVVINAAGIQGGEGAIGHIWETDPVAFNHVIDVNLTGSYHVLHHAIRHMLENSTSNGRLIMFSGGGSTSPRSRFAAYGSSKTGVLRLVETCATELDHIGSGILVFAVAPGAVHTAMTEETLKYAHNAGVEEVEAASRTAGEKGVPPKKAADLCEFLAGPDSSTLRGRLIHVNEQYKGYVKRQLDDDAGTLRRVDYPSA